MKIKQKTNNFVIFFKEYLNTNIIIKKVIENSSWLIGDKILTLILGVFVTSIIARYFGPEKFGLFNFSLSFTALFTALSTLGLETLVVKDIIDGKYNEETILYTSFTLRTLGGLILTIISFVFIRILEPNDKNVHLLVLIMSLVMVVKAFEVIEYWIQAHQKAKISSIIRILAYSITSILKVSIVVFKGNIIHYSLVFLVDAFIIGITLVIVFFKIGKRKFHFRVDFEYGKNILNRSWYMILSGLMVTLYMRVDQVMLGTMLKDKTELGIYSVAAQVASMWYFVPLAIITSFKPVIIKNKSIDNKYYIESIQFLYFIVTWIGILFSVLIMIFSKFVINLLFGIEYAKAVGILNVSVWSGIFATLGSARSIWLISEGNQRYTIVYTFFGFIINILLNYLLIPVIGGYGAAIATLIAQFFANVIVLLFFKETRISSLMIIKSFSIISISKRISKSIGG